MPRASSNTLLALVLAAALAGCFGGSDEPLEEDFRARAGEETAGVYGIVVDDSFDPVLTAEIRLERDTGSLVAWTRSAADGRYRVSDVLPGEYRLVVVSDCCHAHVQGVTLIAQEVSQMDLFLTRVSQEERLQAATVGPRELTGMISCGTAIGLHIDACWYTDSNAVRIFDVDIAARLQTVTVGLVWEETTPLGPEELTLQIRRGPSGLYKEATGGSPLEFRLDNEEIEDEEDRFPVTGWGNIRYEVRMPPGTTLVFQQPFEIYYTFHYGMPAPDGYSTIPDR